MNLQMGSSYTLVFFILIILQFCDGYGARQTINNGNHNKQKSILRLHSMDASSFDKPNHHHVEDHMKQYTGLSDSDNIFFLPEDLKIGKKMSIYFKRKDSSSFPQLLSREEANEIPFSSEQLPNVLSYLSMSRDSPEAKIMEETLRMCELKPIKGETSMCATSFESMAEFAENILEIDEKTQTKVLSTAFLSQYSTTRFLQNYTIFDNPREILAPKVVACHTRPYPYAVFYCHSLAGENRVFQVPLESENGDKVEAISVCHSDTSQWDRNHVSFRILEIERGRSAVCHFFQNDNFVWVPSPAS